MIGTQSIDIRRDPDRLSESAMGNMVADAMRVKYPGVDGAYHQLRRAPSGSPDSPRRVPANSPVKITWGEVFGVLPFGNRR